MDEIESAHKNVMEILKSIKTLDELKENKEAIVKTYIGGLKSGLEGLKAMKKESKPNQEILAKYDKLQSSRKNMQTDVESEIARIRELPMPMPMTRDLM